MRQVCEFSQYAEPPVLPELGLQSTVQVQSEDNRADFHFLLFFFLSSCSSVHPPASNHAINPVLIAVVPPPNLKCQPARNAYENVIYTQSRWVLKGQICNLLTSTDVVPHLPAALKGTRGKGENWIGGRKTGAENNQTRWYSTWTPLGVILLFANQLSTLKGTYNANSTFVVLLYVHMRSWHVSQPTNAWKKQLTRLVVIPRCQTRYA